MHQIWKSFRALYFASLMMLIGSGLLSTYLALRLAADDVDGLWIGALMAANYFGLVLGGKIGHRLIARVGHIRAYATCAGIVGAAVLCHGLTDWLPIWLLLLAVLRLFAAPLKLAGKLLVNTLLGFALLGILSALGVLAKISLGLNLFNALVIAVLGVPGLALLILLRLVFI